MNQKFVKWGLIGLMGTCFILFIVTQVFFNPFGDSNKENPSGASEQENPSISGDSNSDSWLEVNETLPNVENPETLKETVWQHIVNQELETAVSVINDAFQTSNITVDEDLVNWYHDVNLLINITTIPTNERLYAMTSFTTPRFQAVFPSLLNALDLASLSGDPTSIIPIDITQFDVASEEVLEAATWNAPTDFLNNVKTQYVSVHHFEVILNHQQFDAYVGEYETGGLNFLGYFGESDLYKTAEYWETNRTFFQSFPIYQ